MLKIILVGLVGLFVVAAAFIAWRLYTTAAGGARVHRQLMARVVPVTEALRSGGTPDARELERLAASAETRKVLHEALAELQRSELFPAAHRTWEKMAEADLVFWLRHPNELGATPDEIELMARSLAPGAAGGERREYFLFRFRTRPPHWAASDGWLAGVAGPYRTSGEPAPHASGTFSRFERYDSRSPEDHIRVTHEATAGR